MKFEFIINKITNLISFSIFFIFYFFRYKDIRINYYFSFNYVLIFYYKIPILIIKKKKQKKKNEYLNHICKIYKVYFRRVADLISILNFRSILFDKIWRFWFWTLIRIFVFFPCIQVTILYLIKFYIPALTQYMIFVEYKVCIIWW